MIDPVLAARVRLALVSGLGPRLTRRLEEAFDNPLEICSATTSQLQRVQGISHKKADLIRRGLDEADLDNELHLIQSQGVQLIAFDDDRYPALLRHIIDPPALLFVRGELQRADGLALAIVGSRKCTQYGREQADRMASLCAQAGLTIISGGAIGIDTAAHEAALRVGGRTIVVLGCGLGQCYPPQNKELFGRVARGGGAVVSELPMTAPPIAENFPARNRIISGLSLGVLVVEASNRSGASITARLAAEEHHREVMAMPGRVDSPASIGCHRMVREGWATLVTSPAEVLDCLGEAGQTLKVALDESAADGAADVASPTPANLQGDAARIFNALTQDAVGIDALCSATGLAVASVQAHLMQLQLSGLVERVPGNQVRRRR